MCHENMSFPTKSWQETKKSIGVGLQLIIWWKWTNIDKYYITRSSDNERKRDRDIELKKKKLSR